MHSVASPLARLNGAQRTYLHLYLTELIHNIILIAHYDIYFILFIYFYVGYVPAFLCSTDYMTPETPDYPISLPRKTY